MQGAADMFLDMLAERGILAPTDVESMREQIGESETTVHPVFVARRLVEMGYLNPYFAKTLLTELARTVAAQDQQDAAAGSRQAEPSATEPSEQDEQDLLEEMGIEALDSASPISSAPIQTAMLPSAGQGWWESLFSRRKPLKLEQPGHERYLLPACVVLVLCVIVLLILIMTGVI